jgi:NAD(P)-dependent dehydrogenase (short-subunit alcohol dehydrogenase family)
VDEVSVLEWNRLLEINLTSAFMLAKAVHPALRETRGSLTLVQWPQWRQCALGPRLRGREGRLDQPRSISREGVGE